MSKAVLVMDMPKHCIDCPCHFAGMSTVVCGVNKKQLLTDDIETYKPNWCPLRELPEKKMIEIVQEDYDGGYSHGFTHGYNACINELLKGEEG